MDGGTPTEVGFYIEDTNMLKYMRLLKRIWSVRDMKINIPKKIGTIEPDSNLMNVEKSPTLPNVTALMTRLTFIILYKKFPLRTGRSFLSGYQITV